MEDIKIKFRGVRGSFPVADRSFLQFGGNTSCVEININGIIIFLDAGTGIVNSGDDLMEKHITSSSEPSKRVPISANILISHIHQDHLLGLTFFKPLHLKSSTINIYGSATEEMSFQKTLSVLVFGKTFPLDLGDIACNMNVRDIYKDSCIVISPDGISRIVEQDNPKIAADDIVITYYKSYVHPQDGVMIYKITYKNKSIVYATDKECYMGGDKTFVKFAKYCDLLIHDAQYTTEDYLNPNSPKQGFGHSTFDMAVETMKQTKAKNLVFYHYEPSYNDAKLSSIKDYYCSDYKNVFMAYEGYEIVL